MFGGNGRLEKQADTLGLPTDLIEEAEGYGAEEIYPDNVDTVRIFSDISTQWRGGASGVIGLDYNVLPMIFEMRQVKKKKRLEIFDGLKIMERAALTEMRR